MSSEAGRGVGCFFELGSISQTFQALHELLLQADDIELVKMMGSEIAAGSQISRFTDGLGWDETAPQ